MDLITTSFKKKRNDLKIYYKNIIEKLYEGLDWINIFNNLKWYHV